MRVRAGFSLATFVVSIVMMSVCACSPFGDDDHAQRPDNKARIKKIALTFDDAPNGGGPVFDTGEERSIVLLDALDAAKTGPVAFFVTTQGLDKQDARARIENYADAGHLIANHSHTHQWASKIDQQVYLSDIDRAETLLAELSIDDAQRRAWFRFPYLDEGNPLEKRDMLRAGLKNRELMNGYVTVATFDWFIESEWQAATRAGRNVDQKKLGKAYVEIMMSAVGFYDDVAQKWLDRSPVHVMLLHENDVNALFVGDLVVALRAQGWEIVSPDEAYRDPINDLVPTTVQTGQGHVAALALEAGARPKQFSHLAVNKELIQAYLAERNVFGPLPETATHLD